MMIHNDDSDEIDDDDDDEEPATWPAMTCASTA